MTIFEKVEEFFRKDDPRTPILMDSEGRIQINHGNPFHPNHWRAKQEEQEITSLGDISKTYIPGLQTITFSITNAEFIQMSADPAECRDDLLKYLAENP